MNQPTPSYTEADLWRVVVRDFPPEKVDEVLRTLSAYGNASWHREALRVRMACLKCAQGDLVRLARWVGVACDDYRDILLEAEYPNYRKARRPDDKERAIERDWQQLQQWLRK